MKYLTHNFIPHTLIDDGIEMIDSYSICETCGVIIIFSSNQKYISNPPYISNIWTKTPKASNIQLTLTCDEIMIKLALE
jgi:hypothetical protein